MAEAVVANESFKFFKVIWQHGEDLKHLSVPKKLKELFRQKMPEDLEFLLYNGAMFSAKYDRQRDVFKAIDGLCKYARLGFGDVLQFDYSGNGRFDLMIFGTSGVEKDLPKPPRSAVARLPADFDGFSIEMLNSYVLDFNPGVYIKKQFYRSTKKLVNGAVITCHKDGKSWELKIAKKGKVVKIVDQRWVKFVRDLGAVVGKVIIFCELEEMNHYDVLCISPGSV